MEGSKGMGKLTEKLGLALVFQSLSGLAPPYFYAVRQCGSYRTRPRWFYAPLLLLEAGTFALYMP